MVPVDSLADHFRLVRTGTPARTPARLTPLAAAAASHATCYQIAEKDPIGDTVYAVH